jgi:adenine-specific DNA methylase
MIDKLSKEDHLQIISIPRKGRREIDKTASQAHNILHIPGFSEDGHLLLFFL